jgi:hypothetical protein
MAPTSRIAPHSIADQLTDQQCYQGNELNRALIDVNLLVAEHIFAFTDV